MSLRRWLRTLRLKASIRNNDPLRVVLGASGIADEGWVATDINTLDITNETHWQRLFAPDSIDILFAEHVWEHLDPKDAEKATALCWKYLKVGGSLRLAVPDAYHPDSNYIEAVKPGGTGPGADDHKQLFTYRSLSSLLSRAGFKVTTLEYFDEDGKFHAEDWDVNVGLVRRSARFDKRNNDGNLNYTSIIVDGTKL